MFTFKTLLIASPSYPPPQRKHLAKSFPVPRGITPTAGCSWNWTWSESDRERKRMKKTWLILFSGIQVNAKNRLPIVSKIHPTVPSPPQQITLKFSTSLNIWSPCMGPPVAKLWTCRGLSMYWNFLSIFSPCLPPDFGFINTKSGVTPGGNVIWKDMAGCWLDDPPLDAEAFCRTKNCNVFPIHSRR